MLNGELCLGYCPRGTGVVYPFDKIFTKHKNLTMGFEGVDAVVLWGGEDIHPSYYNEKPHPKNQARGGGPSHRDKFEWKVMTYCYMEGIPIIGVCRGAQFLCAFAGGSLIQHVDGHHSDHDVNTDDGQKFKVTSCHHQMMYPYDVNHKLLAWSSTKRSTVYEDQNSAQIKAMDIAKEPEIVLFPDVRGLAIQGHPEWASEDTEFVKYVNGLVRTHLLALSDAPF